LSPEEEQGIFLKMKAMAIPKASPLDLKFPALAALAAQFGSSFRDQIEGSTYHKEPLRLSDCCMMEALGAPRWGHCDQSSYLATLERMVEILLPMGACPKKLWSKIKNPSETIFLDTVAETVWTIRFHELGLPFGYEVPLDEKKSMPKDADFKVQCGDGPIWLDSTAISVPSQEPQPFPYISGRGRTVSVNVFLDRAKRKYAKKFKDEVDHGALAGQRTGILVNLLKAEKELLSPFLFGGLEEVNEKPPAGLFTERRSRLTCVLVANFVRREGQEYLSPNVLVNWARPS
jgi:hypothetical protein